MWFIVHALVIAINHYNYIGYRFTEVRQGKLHSCALSLLIMINHPSLPPYPTVYYHLMKFNPLSLINIDHISSKKLFSLMFGRILYYYFCRMVIIIIVFIVTSTTNVHDIIEAITNTITAGILMGFYCVCVSQYVQSVVDFTNSVCHLCILFNLVYSLYV